MPGTSRTAAAADLHGLDLVWLGWWLTARTGRPVGPLTARRVGIGQSNLTYRVQDDAAAAWVLRRPPLGSHLDSAHDIVREAQIMAALGDSDVRVPGVLGVIGAGSLGWDVPAAVIAHVDGRVVDRPEVLAGLSPADRARVGPALAVELAAIHAVDLPRQGLTQLASHQPYAPRQLRRWTRQWQDSARRDLPALDALTRRLTAAVPDQQATVLVHGDFHLRNVLLSHTAVEIEAVLDWELCTLGDPIADLGTLLAYWPAPGEAGADVFTPSTEPGFSAPAELVETYARVSGRDVATVGYWHALAVWKIAVIAEGVMQRTAEQPANAAAAGVPTADLIDGLIDRAHRVAAAAGH